MNKLYLIGNGFDLAHGLKTRYSDFLLWYVNKLVKFYIGSNSGSYRSELMDIVNDSYKIKEFDSLDSLIAELRARPKAFQFKSGLLSKLFTKIKDLNWVDIEYEYYLELLGQFKGYEEQYRTRDISVINNLKKFHSKFNLIKEQLLEYLKTIDTNVYNKTIAERLKKEINKVNRSEGKVLFLVFNYTNTLDTYLELLKIENYEVIYIHGKLRDEENPIIFGYGDEMDEYYSKIESLNVNEFTENMKSFWYFKTNNIRRLYQFMDNHFMFNVSILGHSCGISDRVLLNSIFCHKYCMGIQIFYHRKIDNENDFFEKTQEISRHFPRDLKDNMRRLIIPFPDSQPLN